ncbi:MAG: hypothetical protein ACR2F8_01720 [Caulobacteraceae bacterium]
MPWSVSWTGEQAFELKPSHDFPGLTDLVQAQRPGVGAPVFAAVHVTRQRMGMAAHLCHVCGRPTPRSDRYLFPVQSGGFVTLADGSMRYGGNVPPVHLACAAKAQRLCPHLSGSMAPPVAFPRDEGRLVRRTDVVPGMEALAKTLPAGLEIVFSCYRLFGPDFSRQVEGLRREHEAAARAAGRVLRAAP